jgi:hypothetical protein
MLKCALVTALVLVGLGALTPAGAAPRGDDCVDCAPAKPDDDNAARIRPETDRQRAPDADMPAQTESPAEAARTATGKDCADCPPRKRYDSVEVVKTSHDVDRSRVINTETVVPVRPKVKEYNKLIIHVNETRNVGVIRHNHRIIEKEERYVKRVPVHARPYRVVQRVRTVLVPIIVPSPPCGCPCTCHASSYAYGIRYGHSAVHAYAYAPRQEVQQVLVPIVAPTVYGYR